MAKPKAKINEKKCLACGGCIAICPKDAISMDGGSAIVTAEKCISCDICIKICPIAAIKGGVQHL